MTKKIEKGGPRSYEMIFRAELAGGVAGVIAFRTNWLEAMSDPVMLSRTIRAERYGIMGVSGRQIDVLVEYGIETPVLNTRDGTPLPTRIVVEVGIKRGRYDGAERWRLTFRRAGPDLMGVVWRSPAALAVATEGGRLTLSVGPVEPNVTAPWEQSFAIHRTSVETVDGLAAIVHWHHRRYYSHLPEDAVAEVVAVLDASTPRTLSEANREVSRLLYAASRERGWRKLTLVERTRFGLADRGQWIRDEDVAAARAAHAGESPTGAGEHSLAAADGAQLDYAMLRGVRGRREMIAAQ